jgi:hypothetical protein
MMQDNILTPKHRKGKKPVKVRKPSKPIDGINHRLLREQAEAAAKAQAQAPEPVADEAPEDNAAPTRAELEAKATELGIRFDGRTKDKKLGQLIADRLSEPTAGD